MGINYSPKVGEVLECHFGTDFPRDAAGAVDHSKLTVNCRLPPEMVKNRLVVVLNGKLNDGCVVVPLSSSKDQDKISRNLHVHIDPALIAGHSYFTTADRWATGEQVQQVSKKRLTKFHPKNTLLLPREVVSEIQRAVVRAISGVSLLQPAAAAPAALVAAAAPAAGVPVDPAASSTGPGEIKEAA